MRKIGLLGGAFDPIHNAHIELGASAKKHLNLDEIWLLIDKEPRNKATQTSYQHRLEMARLATQAHDYFIVDKLAMQREGRTYGVKSLREIREMYPDHTFTLIAGLDAIAHFDKWESPEIFIQHVDFAIAGRPGHDKDLIDQMKRRLGDVAQDFRYTLLPLQDLHLSSTAVRRALRDGNNLKDSLHEDVIEYVIKQQIYNDRISTKT